MTGSISSISQARERKADAVNHSVYSCGKCQEQATLLLPDNAIMCGRRKPEVCNARMAADWYEPTNAKSKGKHPRPRIRKVEGVEYYACGRCFFAFFHMQSDGRLTCYREGCKTTALFRWSWHEDLTRANA